MQQERRKTVRRLADRQVIERLRELESGLSAGQRAEDDAAREQRHLRRRAIRHECKVRIALEVVHSTGHLDTWTADQYHVKGRLLDLSASGASLFTKEALGIGQRLALIIQLPQGGEVRARGEVRWSKGVPNRDGYASGVQFEQTGAQDRQRITRFLSHLDATIGL